MNNKTFHEAYACSNDHPDEEGTERCAFGRFLMAVMKASGRAQ